MAEERVKIAEIDIGVDKLVKSAGQVKQEIERLRKSQKELKKDTDGLTSATQEQLDEYTRTEIEIKNLNKEYRASNKVIDAYINIQNQEIRTINDARDANLKLMAIKNDLDTTNEDHLKLINKINKEVDENTDFIKKNSSEYEKTKINIGNYKESIKEAYNELGIFGKYQGDVNNIMTAFGPVFTSIRNEFKQGADDIKNSTKATEGMTAAQRAQQVSTLAGAGALKIFRAALIATGLGAFLVILGSVVAYLASTQEGIDKVNRVLTPLKEVMGTLLGVVQDFGKEIFEAFSNPKQLIKDVGEAIKQNLINRFTALDKIIKAVMDRDWNGIKDGVTQAATGVENLSEKLDAMGDKISQKFGEAWERGKQIEKIQQNLNKTEAAYIKQQAVLKREFEEQNKLADDQTKSAAEREAAAKRAIAAQEEISKGSIERIKQEAEILRLKQMANDTSDKEKAELATKLAEIDQRIAEEASKTKEAQNKLNAVVKQETDKRSAIAREAIEKDIEAQKEVLDLFLAQQGTRAKSLQEELKIAEEVSKKKLQILDAEYKAGKVSKTAYETAKLEITQEFAEKQTEVAIANAEREFEIFRQNHQSKLDANKFLSEQLLEQEQERLNQVAQKERDLWQIKLSEGIINQQEYNDAINKVNEENRKSQEELLKERQQAIREQEAIDFKNRQELEQGNFLAKMELERERLEQQRQLEIENAEKTGADIALINEKYAQQEKQRQEAIKDFNIQTRGETFKNLATILGKESAAGKAAAVAATTIDTYQAATAAYKAMAGIPVVGPALGAIAAAAAVASGLETVKQITNVKKPDIPKAARGIVMDIGGKRHAQGGTTFYDENGNPVVEAESGEKMVILKREASQELNVLSALNQKHGGVPLSKPVTYANNGGAVIRPAITSVPRGNSQPFDYDRLGDILADRVNAIQPVVPVDSINEINTRNSKIVNGASE